MSKFVARRFHQWMIFVITTSYITTVHGTGTVPVPVVDRFPPVQTEYSEYSTWYQ